MAKHVRNRHRSASADPAGHALPPTEADRSETLRELQKAQQYQAAISDIRRLISRSAFDLASVLLMVVTSAKELCRAEMAVLFRYYDGAYRFEVGHCVSPAYEELERRQVIAPGRDTLVGRTVLERRTVEIVDAWSDPEYARKDDARVGGVRSMLGVPLLRDGMPIGAIGLGRAVVAPYTEREIELVSTFADHAVIAIENVRLIEELQSARQAAERARDAAEAARREAEAANRAKSTFLAAMSHEIRTPMNGVLGMMEVLEHSSLGPAAARTVAVMRESAQALLRIVDDVLDFSKIDAGRMELEALPFSLQELVAGTVEAMLPEARRKHLVLLANRLGTGPDWVTGDAVRVRQILINLIGNAIKFTEHGSVSISFEGRAAADGTVPTSITVTDSGIGMDEGTRTRLFEPFMQADSSTRRRFGGTGLGLSIVRRLAQLMGGDVAVDCAPGQGSRFTVTIRLAAATTSLVAADAPEHPPVAAPILRPEVPPLLVADDHPVNREVILRQLELLGLSAEVADDGTAALARWHDSHHAVVLLDLHMPALDGFGLVTAIRCEEARRHLPPSGLIAVSADALKGQEQHCLASGMDGFLAKPVSLSRLASTLARWFPNLAPLSAPPGVERRALFDRDLLRSLIGDDAARAEMLIRKFALSAGRDIRAMQRARSAHRIAALAHRLNGAARTAGAGLLWEEARRTEVAANAGDLAAARTAADTMDRLLAETLSAMRSVD